MHSSLMLCIVLYILRVCVGGILFIAQEYYQQLPRTQHVQGVKRSVQSVCICLFVSTKIVRSGYLGIIVN